MSRRRPPYEQITVGPLSEFPGDVRKAYERQKVTHFATLPNGSIIVALGDAGLRGLQQLWADAHNVKINGEPKPPSKKS